MTKERLIPSPAAVIPRVDKILVPTEWQKIALSIPEACDLFGLSGRGLGKTTLLLFLILRRVQMYPGISRILVLRNTAISLGEFRMELEAICAQTYGAGVVKLNKQQGTFVFPCGALVQLGHLDDLSSTHRWQGSSWDLLAVDEAGNADLSLVDILMGSLRSGSDIPCRLIMLGNPGGIAHQKLYTRYMKGKAIGKPHTDELTGRPFIVLGGTARQNKHLPDSYLASMGGIAKSNPALHAAWVTGDWSKLISGAFFAGTWDAERNIIPSFDKLPPRLVRGFKLGVDIGYSAPSYCAFMSCVGNQPYELPTTGQIVGPNSWIVWQEVETSDPLNPSRSDGATVQAIASEVFSMANLYGVRAKGVIDASCMTAQVADQVPVVDMFRKEGVRLKAARKGSREPRLAVIRELLANAGDPKKAGLYFCRATDFAISTIPEIQRDPKNPNRTHRRANDHALDAISYAIAGSKSRTRVTKG